MTDDRVQAARNAADGSGSDGAVASESPAVQPGKPKILIRGLEMAYEQQPGRAQLQILDKIDLSVRAGEFVCIVGASGCGKSTLLNILSGFLKPTRGEVRIDDAPVAKPDPRRIFIFQDCAVFPWLTVRENIGFGLFNRPAAERESVVGHYIEMVGLRGFEDVHPHELSGGMRQRVEIARALAANPDVLYMDEPLGALDYLTRLAMRNELVQIWQREQITILFVTHDVDEAVQLADRIVVLSPRPAAIRRVIEVPLPRPRDLDAPEYLRLRDRILDELGLLRDGAHADADAPARFARRPAPKVRNG